MSDLEAALAAIPNMSVSELADRWQALGRGSAPRVPLRVLQRLYAQLLQERAFGGLSADALEELAAAAAKAGKVREPVPPPPRQVMLTAGTRLVREWNGRTISVDVQGEGYIWNDQHYGSLSEIARAVTGTRSDTRRFGPGTRMFRSTLPMLVRAMAGSAVPCASVPAAILSGGTSAVTHNSPTRRLRTAITPFIRRRPRARGP